MSLLLLICRHIGLKRRWLHHKELLTSSIWLHHWCYCITKPLHHYQHHWCDYITVHDQQTLNHQCYCITNHYQHHWRDCITKHHQYKLHHQCDCITEYSTTAVHHHLEYHSNEQYEVRWSIHAVHTARKLWGIICLKRGWQKQYIPDPDIECYCLTKDKIFEKKNQGLVKLSVGCNCTLIVQGRLEQ